MKQKITISFGKLLRLASERELNAGEFIGRNKKLLGQFLDDGVLEIRMVGTHQRKIFCRDPNNLAKYLHNKFGISSLDALITFGDIKNPKRSDYVRVTSNSKFKKVKVFEGFLINVYNEFECELSGQPLLLKPRVGAFTFISDFKNFQIPDDATVVVVENHENFREIHRQKYLFQGLKPLFVWRYQNSTAISQWLSMIRNSYVHFGDFDPKGVHIYLSEFKRKLNVSRCRFLVPENLEMLIRNHGEEERFYNQEKFLSGIRALHDGETSPIIDIIAKYRKGLDQEILIK